MTVETTLAFMFSSYPKLFASREDCFNHLFCTIGNNYKWMWGQLVESDVNESDKSIHDDDYACPSIGKVGVGNKHKHQHWYPLSKKFSKLFTAPDDIKPDWKAAIEECKKMLEKDGIDWRNVK